MENSNDLIDAVGAASILCLSVRTLERWRRIGEGPHYFHLRSNVIRYSRRELQDWIETKRRRSTSEQPAHVAG